MKKETIKLFEKEFEIKLNLRSMLKFNEITGKDITEISGLAEMFSLFYAVCLVGSKLEFTFDEFCDELDDNPEALNKLNSLFKQGE